MYDNKKKKEELEKKDKVSSMMTKDSVKKEEEKEEEKPDMRSKYAMINIIKNKLRAAGQRDPMVMAVDACEERTPAQDDKSFDKMRPGGSNSQYDKDGKPKKKKPPTGPAGGESPFKPGVDNKIDPKKGKGKKTVIPVKVKTGATGGESQRKKDILPKPEKRTPFNPGVKKNIDPKKGTGKKTAVPAYNPYGKGASATPTNMAPGKP